MLKRFLLLIADLTLHIDYVQKKLDECLSAKASYEKNVYLNYNVVEIITYGLCA